MSKKQLVSYAIEKKINTKNKTKKQLIQVLNKLKKKSINWQKLR